VKHAEANVAEVHVSIEPAALQVAVQDDGRGFDPSAPVAPSADGSRGGQGLRSMRERAQAAGLQLRIASEPGAGTTVTIAASLPR